MATTNPNRLSLFRSRGARGTAAPPHVARALAWSGQRRAIAIGSTLIIPYNGILHSFWGSELFLYASHWLIPLVMLMAGFLELHPRAEGVCGAAFASLCVVVGVVNAQNLAEMFSALRLQATANEAAGTSTAG